MSRIYNPKTVSGPSHDISRVYDQKPELTSSIYPVYMKKSSPESSESISRVYTQKSQTGSSDSMFKAFSQKSLPNSDDYVSRAYYLKSPPNFPGSMTRMYIKNSVPEFSGAVFQDPRSLPKPSHVSSQNPPPRWNRIHRESAHTECLLGRFLPIGQDESPGTTAGCRQGDEVRDQFTQRVASVKLQETKGDIAYLRNHLGLCLPTDQQVLQWKNSGLPVASYPWHSRVARTQTKLAKARAVAKPERDADEQNEIYKKYQQELRSRQEVELEKSMQYAARRRQQCQLRRRYELRHLDQVLKKIEVEVNKHKNMEIHWRRLALKHSEMKRPGINRQMPEGMTTQDLKSVNFMEQPDNRNQSGSDNRRATHQPTHHNPPKEESIVPLLVTLGTRKDIASVGWKKGVTQT